MNTPNGSFLENNVQTKIFVNWTDTYICSAWIWTALTEKWWAIKKVDVDWNVTYPINTNTNRVEFSFSFIANNYAWYTYDYSIN